MLVEDGQALRSPLHPESGMRIKLRRAYGHQFFERLLFVVASVCDEERGLGTGGISEIRRTLIREYVRWQAVPTDEMNRQLDFDECRQRGVIENGLRDLSGLVG